MQVRADWGIKASVGIDGWQAIMRQYLRQDRQQAQEAAQQLLIQPHTATAAAPRPHVLISEGAVKPNRSHVCDFSKSHR